MKLKCRLGKHDLVHFRTTKTERYRFTHFECSRCGVRKTVREDRTS